MSEMPREMPQENHPQDAEVTRPVTAGSTERLPAENPPSRTGAASGWMTWVPASGQPTSAPASAAATPSAAPEATSRPSTWRPPEGPPWTPPPVPPVAPQVTRLPAPTGPNWGLVLVGLFFVLVAVALVANQVAGFQMSDLTKLGPNVLVLGGLGCALVGVIGILSRRRR
jgi:hypothetical protein